MCRTDGLRFVLDGITYEFDTGAPAGVGAGAVAIPLTGTVTLRSFRRCNRQQMQLASPSPSTVGG